MINKKAGFLALGTGSLIVCLEIWVDIKQDGKVAKDYRWVKRQ